MIPQRAACHEDLIEPRFGLKPATVNLCYSFILMYYCQRSLRSAAFVLVAIEKNPCDIKSTPGVCELQSGRGGRLWSVGLQLHVVDLVEL